MSSRIFLGASRRYAAAFYLCVVVAVTTSAIAVAGPLAPLAPDYSQDASWAAWPGRPSGADIVPPGVMEPSVNERARVDVFFVHPTTYMSGSSANARFDEPGATSTLIDRGVLRSQASAFNHCCRIYAPRYRQAALATFFHRDDALDSTALNLAYDKGM